MAFRRLPRRRLPACLRLVLVASYALSGSDAAAGAWTRKAGEGEVIVSGLYAEASGTFDGAGDPADFRKADLQAHAEFGLTDRLTAIGRAEWKSASSEDTSSFDTGRFGLVGLGARYPVFESRGAVVSVEAVGRIAADREASDEAGDLDLRIAAGYGFSVAALPAFVDAEGAFRSRFGGPADEIRVDLTAGLRPEPRLLLLAQSFNTVAIEPSEGRSVAGREHKVAISAVYEVSPRLALQLGGLVTVAGRDVARERGLITALWFRF